MIDWKRKLTSRKLWVALCGFVAGLLIYLGKTEAEAERVTALIMSAASVMAYILGEGLADAGGGWIEPAEEEEAEAKPPDEELQ